VAEDWRVTATLHEQEHRAHLMAMLHEHEVEADARQRLGGRVAVSGEGNHVFLYADTDAAARGAQRVVEQLLPVHGMSATFKVDRWHHEEERWEDASVPLPATPEARRVEHERLEQEETEESQGSGVAEWEVRIELASHHDAHALAERLESEGVPSVVRRWKYLLIGANDQDDAAALAKRLQGELPPGATIHVEPGSGLAWQLTPGNAFAIFGGLSG
jgi:extradiol dioxygenase family protein